MDSLTQAVLGAACGELVLGKKLGNKAFLWGAAVGTLPDLDILFNPLFDNAGALGWHRGISHSLLAIVLLPLVIAWLMRFVHRKNPECPSFGRAYAFAILNYATHVLIDCFTVYGTQLFAPFNDARVALNMMFIIDLFFTLPLIVAPLFYLFMKRNRVSAPSAEWTALIWCSLYAMFATGMKWKADSAFDESLAASGITAERFHSAPTFSNVALWRGLAETADGYYIGYHSNIAPDVPITWEFVPRDEMLLALLGDTRGVRTVKWFSRGFYTVQMEPGGILLFSDLRFGEFESGGRRHYMFNWKFLPDGDIEQVSTARPEPRKLLSTLLSRLRGKTELAPSGNTDSK